MIYLDPTVDPYDPNVPDYEPQTMPMDEIIRMGFWAQMLNVKVCIPCSITQVNSNQSVNVQPLLQVRYINQAQGSAGTTMPQIQHVPVSMPLGNGYSIKLPVAVGDTGFCVFSDRSIDSWLAGSGGVTDPQDSRQHDISDAIFIPGLVPFSKQTQDNTTDLVVTNGAIVTRFMKSGAIKFTDGTMLVKFNADGTYIFSNGTNELMDLLTQITSQLQTLSQTLSTDTVNTIFGPMKLNAFAQYTTIANTLQTLLNKLNTLKGT